MSEKIISKMRKEIERLKDEVEKLTYERTCSSRIADTLNTELNHRIAIAALTQQLHDARMETMQVRLDAMQAKLDSSKRIEEVRNAALSRPGPPGPSMTILIDDEDLITFKGVSLSKMVIKNQTSPIQAIKIVRNATMASLVECRDFVREKFPDIWPTSADTLHRLATEHPDLHRFVTEQPK